MFVLRSSRVLLEEEGTCRAGDTALVTVIYTIRSVDTSLPLRDDFILRFGPRFNNSMCFQRCTGNLG